MPCRTGGGGEFQEGLAQRDQQGEPRLQAQRVGQRLGPWLAGQNPGDERRNAALQHSTRLRFHWR